MESKTGKDSTDLSDRILILMMGLPYSGKTTESHSLNAPVVCPDAIRIALHGQRYRDASEPMVWAIAHTMVESLFYAGHRVVVLDACNVSRKRRDEWRRGDWSVEVFEAHEGLGMVETCRSRANAAGDLEILPSITRMACNYEPLHPDEKRYVDTRDRCNPATMGSEK